MTDSLTQSSAAEFLAHPFALEVGRFLLRRERYADHANANKTGSAIDPTAQPANGSHLDERLRYFEARQDQSSTPSANSSRSNLPATTSPPRIAWARSWPRNFKRSADALKSIAPTDFADNLQIDFEGREKTKPVLLLGHFDTVYPLGTLANMPCRVDDGRLHGPGVLDMKSGIALMFHAIEALQTWHGGLPRPVTVFLVSDEEVGSHSSRTITEALARKSAAVLVLEPAAGRGAVKTARKGVGEYSLTVKGVAAHAGLDPGKGHSAIVELARQITVISKFNDLKRGLSVNPGIHSRRHAHQCRRGGSRCRNRCPHQASEASRGARSQIPRPQAFRQTLQAQHQGRHQPSAHGTNCRRRRALQESSGHCTKQIDWKLEEAAVGGGSDGNFTAGIGIPTLDGMGGVGDGAHALHEHILISELPRRALLLAGMIESV